MPCEVEIITAAEILTAVIRERVKRSELSRFVPAACGEVWSFLRSAQVPRPGRHVALYLQDSVVEVGAEVGEPFIGNGRIVCSRLPAGPVATSTHYGPYGLLGEAHDRIRQWCESEGHRLANICWEIYGHWDDSWNTDPSQIRTDVFYLLEARDIEPRAR